MKMIYLIFIVVLILVAVGFELLVIFLPLGGYSRLEKAIQSAGIFVALLAAIIALSTADSKRKSVNMKMELSIDKADFATYHKNELSDDLKKIYKNFSDPIKSYKVHFKMTNISGFTLKKPTLTFSLPLQKQHPHKTGNIYLERTFNSNLINSQHDLRLLEFADTRILSNSNLPYWNDQDCITIWIRMALDTNSLEPFMVNISLNCENAEGVTKKVEINQKELVK